ncbi:head completion/stabilization protein [uncultured Novosphingobium sp.]|uniref:head completion/stabilization protein n=1 Tax=uncultured Novosphingobium sp. TaxID=292277 RepID=UPI002591DB30|nr:head completion/stabilization protein [uncultured Novosphingobium sp.]
MSFVSLPPTAEIEQPATAEQPVINDGFFPDVDPVAVRDDARIPPSITPARLRAAILGAIMTAGNDLAAYAAARKAEGNASLASVPAEQLDGQSVQLIRYRRAVALYAKAELVERHRDFDTTAAGNSQGEDLTASIGDLRRDAMHAVRDILGKPRTTVDLI